MKFFNIAKFFNLPTLTDVANIYNDNTSVVINDEFQKGNMVLGPFKGYDNLLDRIIEFFKTGNVPVSPEETLEIYTFMEAADESKRSGGKSINLNDVYQANLKKFNKIKHKLNLPQ